MNKYIETESSDSYEVWVENVATGQKERANGELSVKYPDPLRAMVADWDTDEQYRAKAEMRDVRVRYFIARVITVRAVEEVVS